MELLVVFACYYFVYISGRQIFDVSPSEWEPEAYLALLIMLIAFIIGTLRLIKYIKKKKQEDDQLVEKHEKLEEEKEARQHRAYLYDAEEYEDELAESEAVSAAKKEMEEGKDAFLDSLFEKQARELTDPVDASSEEETDSQEESRKNEE